MATKSTDWEATEQPYRDTLSGTQRAVLDQDHRPATPYKLERLSESDIEMVRLLLLKLTAAYEIELEDQPDEPDAAKKLSVARAMLRDLFSAQAVRIGTEATLRKIKQQNAKYVRGV